MCANIGFLPFDSRPYLRYAENLKMSEYDSSPKEEAVPTVKVWGRGQLTIPASMRKELHLEEDASLTVVKVGDVLLLTPHKLIGDTIAKKAARGMKQAGLKLDDLLADLKKQRERYNRERNGA